MSRYPCPLCGGPAPWHVWFGRDGSGCRHEPALDTDAVAAGRDLADSLKKPAS